MVDDRASISSLPSGVRSRSHPVDPILIQFYPLAVVALTDIVQQVLRQISQGDRCPLLPPNFTQSRERGPGRLYEKRDCEKSHVTNTREMAALDSAASLTARRLEGALLDMVEVREFRRMNVGLPPDLDQLFRI